jgi:hypothetical protein
MQYQVEGMTDAEGFIWTFHLDEKFRIGVSFSKEIAIINAERAIDNALGSQPAAKASAPPLTPKP